MRGSQSKSSLNYGFVKMKSNDDAMRAIAELNAKLIYGRRIKVHWAIPHIKTNKESTLTHSVHVKYQSLMVSILFLQ